MRKVEKFQAQDSRIFDTETECLQHERECLMRTFLSDTKGLQEATTTRSLSRDQDRLEAVEKWVKEHWTLLEKLAGKVPVTA